MNRDRPLRTGYTMTPNKLWTLPGMTPKEILLLGWLHSHADNYADRLTSNRIRTEFGAGGHVKEYLVKLEQEGFLTIADDGFADHVILLSAPWEALKDTADPPERGGNPPERGTKPSPLGRLTLPNGEPEEEQGEVTGEVTVEQYAHSEKCADETFDLWWKIYPRKLDKKRARTAWKNMTDTNRHHAIDALPIHVAAWEQEGRGSRTTPHPTTWLHGERWDDELAYRPEQPVPQASNTRVNRSRDAIAQFQTRTAAQQKEIQ